MFPRKPAFAGRVHPGEVKVKPLDTMGIGIDGAEQTFFSRASP